MIEMLILIELWFSSGMITATTVETVQNQQNSVEVRNQRLSEFMQFIKNNPWFLEKYNLDGTPK